MNYPKTVAAVQAAEQGTWGIAHALWEEIPKTEKGQARKGAYQEAREAIDRGGVDGASYSIVWLKKLHILGGWVNGYSRLSLSMPVAMAIVAKEAGLTAEEAQTQWGLGHDDGQPWTLRRWSEVLGRKWSDVAAETAEEAVAAAKEREIPLEDVVVAAVHEEPDSVGKAAEKDEAVQEAVNKAARYGPDEGEVIEVTATEVDYDQLYQDAATEIVNREADRAQGRWTPNELTEAFRHFLIRALTADHVVIDPAGLVAEIEAHLAKEAAAR